MRKKSEFYDLANLYSSEILNEGFLGRTASGAAKGAGAGGLLGGALGAGLGAAAGGIPGAITGAKIGSVTGAVPGAGIGGVTNAAAGRDDDEEDKDSIEMSLPKKDISAICKSLKKALGAEEDSEEEDTSEEEAEDTRIFSDEEADSILKNLPKTTNQPVASMTPGADALKSPGGSLKDVVSQGVRTDLGQNPAGVTPVKAVDPWISQAVSDMPEGSMKEIGQSFSSPVADTVADTAGSGVLDTAKGALAGAGEAVKGMNPLLLGGLAAGGGLLAGKMLGGKKNKEEEEDSFLDTFNKPVNPEKGTGAMLKPLSAPSTTSNAKGIADTVMGDIKSAASAAKPPSTAASFSGPIGAGAETVKTGIGSTFGDLASKAGEFVSNMHPAAKLGLAAGGGYLASKMMDDDEEEGGNGVSKALEYSRNEISNRLSNALNSLEEFDIKKAREVLKNLINDL